MSPHSMRRDRGVALPSPVAAISVAAIVVAAIAFAVTGFGGSNGNKDITPRTTPTSSLTSPAATNSGTPSTTPTATPTAATFDKSKLHVSVFNAGTVKGLAATTEDKAKAAGWTDVATGTLHGGYTRNVIYYPTHLANPADNAMWAAAARQLGLDLGIPADAITGGDTATRQDRLTVVMLTPLS